MSRSQLPISSVNSSLWRHPIRLARLLISSVLRRYADWRVGAVKEDMVTGSPNGSILITFDDYGSPAQVAAVLRILDVAHVKAAFFMQGDWAEQHPDLVNRLKSAGHIVANHTYSHANLLAVDDQTVRKEILGGPASTWLRPPYGRFNARVRRIAAELGYTIKYWSIDSDDWRGVSGEYMMQKIDREIAPGAVILFHLHVEETLKALPGIIELIRARGMRLCEPNEPIWGEQ